MIATGSEKINFVCHNRSNSGLRIVRENINRRVSDVFNTKSEFTPIEPMKLKLNKQNAFEMNNKLIEDLIRSKSPYFSGQKNTKYISKSLLTSNELWGITNPSHEKNYNQIITQTKAYNENKEKVDSCSIEFFKPSSQHIRYKTDNNRGNHIKGQTNRSFVARNGDNDEDEESPLNKSAIITRPHNLDEINSTFDFNEKCKSKQENLIKGKLKRNQMLTENATFALMMYNKQKEYKIPAHNSLKFKNKRNDVEKDMMNLTTFDLNEKNKEIINSQINEKIQQRKKLIDDISQSLLTQRKAEKESLSNKFQTQNNSFNNNNSRDYLRERYEKNYNQNKIVGSSKSNTYFDQIKAFNSKHYEFNDEMSQINLDTPFRNHKKVSEILHETKLIYDELDNSRMLNSKTVKKITIPIEEYKRLKSETEKKAWR